MTAVPWPWRSPSSLLGVAGSARSVTRRRREARAGRRAWDTATAQAARRTLVDLERWRPVWRAAAEGAGIGRQVHVVAGVTALVPALERVLPDGALVVRLLPGQLPADITAAGDRLAPWLDCAVVRVEARGATHVVIRRLAVDPLADVVDLPPAPAPAEPHAEDAPAGHEPAREWARDPSWLALDEAGHVLALSWQARPHAVVQGTTGSGKSVFTYGLLADAARRADVLVAGLDPTGLLFRPFAGSRHAEWQVSGLAEGLAAHVALLERLVAEMDRRVAALPADQDNLTADEATPVLVVVLEEWAGVLRSADAAGRDTGKRVRALVARLLAEGRKAAVRVLLIVQRADATTIGAFERGQCALRVSFAVDTPSAVELLHPGAPEAAAHVGAPAGVALVTLPGRAALRVRAGRMTAGYAEYVERVRQACA